MKKTREFEVTLKIKYSRELSPEYVQTDVLNRLMDTVGDGGIFPVWVNIDAVSEISE